MRVVHVLLGRCNPESANGVDKSLYYLTQAQAASGAEVSLLSITSREPLSIPGVDVRATAPPVVFRHNTAFWKVPLAWYEVKHQLLRGNPDIVHFHSVHIGPFVDLARHLAARRVPYVITPHGGYAVGRLEAKGWAQRAYIRSVERDYIEKAACVHVVSEADVKGLQYTGISPRRIVLAPNGFDPANIPRNVPRGFLRSRYPHLEKKRVFLFLGRLDPSSKGLDLLIDGYAHARPPNSALVLVGPDANRCQHALSRQAEYAGLQVGSDVMFTGPMYGDEKWACLADANVFVHPSRWEAGVPFSVLEAMAAGCPCLLTTPAARVPGFAERGAAVVVQPSAMDIARGIRSVAALDRAELAAMGENAKQLIHRDFAWDSIARFLLATYENVIRHARPQDATP